MQPLTAERQIDNVLASLLDLTNGPAYPDRMAQIRATARQLATLWELYKASELLPLADDGLAF